jgi:hypothetical protein
MIDSKGLSSLVCFGGRLRDERYSVMVTLRDHYQNKSISDATASCIPATVTGHENQLPI